jgi:hypothetical protein
MADEASRIEIVNWGEFQHYNKRLPPWIKLHRSLLNKREWHALSGDASKLLAECWLVAAEHKDGWIEKSTADLAWRLRRGDQETARLLKELEAQGFILLINHDASGALAGRQQGATPETETETEERESSEAKASGSELPEFEPSKKPSSPQGEMMAVLRECGYACDRTDGSIVKALLRTTKPETIEEAVRGLAALWKAGELRGVKTPNMRLLYAEGDGVKMHLWARARVAFEQARKQFTPARLEAI